MHETPAEIDALQALLDRSVATSGEHLTGIITPERRLSARQIIAAMQGMKVLVLATVTAAGQPRTSCVDGHFLHGTWLFSTDASAVKARHLKARPALSCTYADGERIALFTHGSADYIAADHPEYAGYDEYLTGHYGSAPSSWGPSIVFIRVKPTWMAAYAMNAAEFPES